MPPEGRHHGPPLDMGIHDHPRVHETLGMASHHRPGADHPPRTEGVHPGTTRSPTIPRVQGEHAEAARTGTPATRPPPVYRREHGPSPGRARAGRGARSSDPGPSPTIRPSPAYGGTIPRVTRWRGPSTAYRGSTSSAAGSAQRWTIPPGSVDHPSCTGGAHPNREIDHPSCTGEHCLTKSSRCRVDDHPPCTGGAHHTMYIGSLFWRPSPVYRGSTLNDLGYIR